LNSADSVDAKVKLQAPPVEKMFPAGTPPHSGYGNLADGIAISPSMTQGARSALG
jgi:hypothetical protein